MHAPEPPTTNKIAAFIQINYFYSFTGHRHIQQAKTVIPELLVLMVVHLASFSWIFLTTCHAAAVKSIKIQHEIGNRINGIQLI